MSAPETERDVIAEALRLDATESEGAGTYERQAHSVLEGLERAGFAVVKLPEPSRTHGDREAKWTDRSSLSEPGYLKWSVGVTEGGIPFASARRGDGPGSRAAADHAAFGAALLAAAAHAEAGGDRG